MIYGLISCYMLDKIKPGLVRILRWSESYAHTDMVYLVKNGGWLMFSRIVGMAFAFGLSLAFANLLPPEVYGTYRYVISVANILMLFTLSNMSTAVIRAIAQGRDGVVKSAVKAEINWGLLGAVCSFALAAYYFYSGNRVLASAFLVVTFFVPFLNVYSIYNSILYGKKLFELSVRYDVLTQVVNLGLILPLLLTTREVWILILPFLFVNSGLQKIWLWRTERKVALNDVGDSETVKYGKQLSFLGILNSFSVMIDQVVVFNLLGPIQLAVYNMALAPAEQIKSIIKIIGFLAFPKFADQPFERLKRSLVGKTLKLALMVFLIVTVYVVLAPWLYSILFPAYSASVWQTRLLAVSLIFGVSNLQLTALQAHGRVKALYWWNISSAIVQIALVILGAAFFGILGVILSRVLARFYDLVCLTFLTARAKPETKQAVSND